jgi:hypothetical protein
MPSFPDRPLPLKTGFFQNFLLIIQANLKGPFPKRIINQEMNFGKII